MLPAGREAGLGGSEVEPHDNDYRQHDSGKQQCNASIRALYRGFVEHLLRP